MKDKEEVKEVWKSVEMSRKIRGLFLVLQPFLKTRSRRNRQMPGGVFFCRRNFWGSSFRKALVKGCFAYLAGPGSNVCPPKDFPAGFLQELAIAYAIGPDYGEEAERELLAGRAYAARVFDIPAEEGSLFRKAVSRLRQPANKARFNAFSDYIAIREMEARGEVTEENRKAWESILKMCQVHYLYERNGKQMGSGAYESRSECVVKLYVQWLKDEDAPRCVLTYFYKNLAFRELERSSTRGLYGGLKEQVVRQLPDVEEIVFGEGGKEQAITKLYRETARIINDHQTNYDHHIYGETDEIRQRIEKLLAQPQWQELKGDRTFFDRLFFVASRLVMPRSLAEWLLGYLRDGGFPEPGRTELEQKILRTMGIERLCKEINYRYDMEFSHEDMDAGKDSGDFWQYFLMRGFGYRHVPVRGQWEEDYIYVKDGECYLPAYVDLMFSPSRVWQKAFVGWDEESQSIAVPVSGECSMPGGRRLRVEFHYHYCLYFVDGRQAVRPVLDFGDLRDCEGHLEDPREFFFLLAVTSITWKDRQEAVALIEKWLGRIPAHPITRPVIARLLAADNDRLPGDARAVYYGEQERFCFRAVVGDEGINVFRQVDYGWQDILFRQPEFGWEEAELPRALGRKAKGGFGDTCETGEEPADRENGNGRTEDFWEETAGEILECLRQPRPARKDARVVAGMGRDEKMAAVLDAMGYDEKGESYCVLRYEDKKHRRHDRVFYGAKAPFGFPIEAQSADYERWMEYLMSVSVSKIKERKWPVARFGWGFKYSNQSDFHPVCVYQGESGSFYAYGTIKMHRGDSIGAVLAELMEEEFEGVTEVETYEGCLTVSRFDHRLEYCYEEKDRIRSLYSEEETLADWFTVFGRFGIWMEFARWMDGLLGEELPAWVNMVVLSLDMDRGGAVCLRGIHREDCLEEDEWEDGWPEEDEGDAKTESRILDGKEALGREGGLCEDEGEETEDDAEYCPDTALFIWRSGIEALREAAVWYAQSRREIWLMRGREVEIVVLD